MLVIFSIMPVFYNHNMLIISIIDILSKVIEEDDRIE